VTARGDELLREAAELLYDDAELFAAILDPDGTVTFANDTALSTVDGGERVVRGESFSQGPWWDHDPVQRETVREHVGAAADGERQQFTATQTAADGTLLDLEVSVRPLTTRFVAGTDRSHAADSDDVVALVATGRDVTERTDLADARQTTLEALEGLYETAADTDQTFEERVRRLLKVGKDHLGLSEAFYTKIDGGVQTIETSDADHPLLQEGEQAALADSYCKETLADGRERRVINHVSETKFAEDDAYEKFGLECYIGSELEVNGTVHGTVCFADTEPREAPLDATELAFVDLLAEWLRHELEHRHQQRRLEHQNERLDRYADVVSHDLRSPLNVATGHLDLARDNLPENADASEHLDAVEEALGRMNELVQEMRTLAQQGDVVGELEVISLSTVAEDAAATALPDEATLTVDTAAGDALAADPERLQTALENLYSNAVDHGGEDVSVTVGAIDARATGGDAGFYVADDGPGFSQDDPGVIFAEGHTTRAEGTGYGLSIVAAIAEAHDWHVSATDSESGGARIEFVGVPFAPSVE
jgi:signal transduction histidine kinase